MGTFSHLMTGTAHDPASVVVMEGGLVADRGETGLVQGIGHHRAPFVWGDGRTVPGTSGAYPRQGARGQPSVATVGGHHLGTHPQESYRTVVGEGVEER